MPIEIRELHIKAVIDSGGGKKSDAGAEAGAGAKSAADGGEQNTEQLIDRCVEKVLEILKEKQER